MLEPDIDGTMYWNLIFMEPCTKGKFRWNHVLEIYGTMYWNLIKTEPCTRTYIWNHVLESDSDGIM